MRYKLLGKSGLRVSEMALGTMTFGEDWGFGASRDECKKQLDTFVAHGGNFIDSAINYTNGSSEKLVGELIAGDRDRFVLATKYSLSTRPDDPNAGGNHRKQRAFAHRAALHRRRKRQHRAAISPRAALRCIGKQERLHAAFQRRAERRQDRNITRRRACL